MFSSGSRRNQLKLLKKLNFEESQNQNFHWEQTFNQTQPSQSQGLNLNLIEVYCNCFYVSSAASPANSPQSEHQQTWMTTDSKAENFVIQTFNYSGDLATMLVRILKYEP